MDKIKSCSASFLYKYMYLSLKNGSNCIAINCNAIFCYLQDSISVVIYFINIYSVIVASVCGCGLKQAVCLRRACIDWESRRDNWTSLYDPLLGRQTIKKGR